MSERGSGRSDDTTATPLIDRSAAAGPRRPCLLVIAGARLGELFPVLGELVIGRDPTAQLCLPDDAGVSRRHARVVCTENGGATIIDLDSANGVYVDGERVTERALVDGAKIRVGQTTVIKYTCYDELEERSQRQLLESALRDGLTHAFNRRYFLSRLAAELRFAERHRQTLALLLADIDQLAAVNEEHGHDAGDQALQRLVERLTATLRAEDVLARSGGDELAVLARGISEDSAEQLAERLCRTAAGAELGRADASIKVTLSIGVVVYPLAGAPAEMTAEQLLTRAEEALNRAKQAGRNRVAT
jgi:diguanylate cyclase (GGDEF)-like protein